MLKSHRNALLEAVQRSGLDPALFHAEEAMVPVKRTSKRQQKVAAPPPPKPPSPRRQPGFFRLLFGIGPVAPAAEPAPPPVEEEKERCFIIRVRNTPLKFTVRPSDTDFDYYGYRLTQFKPGYPEQDSVFSTVSFSRLLNNFREWLEKTVRVYLKEEETPDLWKQIETYRSFVDEPPVEDRDTSDFSEEEKADVRQSVEEFKRLVAENFVPTVEQQEYIDRELDYLSNAVDRLNRFDWRGLAISTLMGIAINLSVDSEKGRLLFKLFQQAFQAGLRLLQ